MIAARAMISELFIVHHFVLQDSQPTACVTCVWAGVDSAWEQEKLEARKMLENAADSHTSGARFVGWRCIARTFAKN
jgi:hypothetical protein